MKPGIVCIMIMLVIVAVVPAQDFGPFKAHFTYYNMFYGARSLGMSNAFTGVANDLSSVFRNPAGIAEFDSPQVYIEYRSDRLSYYYPAQTSTNGSTSSTYTYDFNSDWKNLRFISVSAPVHFWDLKWNFALSYYRYFPYGFTGLARGNLTTAIGNTTTDQTTTLSFQGQSGIDILAVSSAFYISPSLSFGFTLQKFFNSGEMGYDFSSPTLSYHSETTEKFDGIGLVMGLLVKLNPQISLGLSYHFQVTDNLTTDINYRRISDTTPTITSSNARLTIPSQITAGVMVQPYRFLSLSFDYAILYWADTRLSNYFGQTAVLEFPARNHYTFLQKNAINYRLGTELNIPYKRFIFYLRGGIFSDAQLFLDAQAEQVKLKGYSLGAGVDISRMARLDLAYMYQHGKWHENTYFNPTTSTLETTYKNKIFCLSLSFSFNRRAEEN